MRFSFGINGLFYVGLALQAVLASVLFRRQLWRKLPFFALYTGFNLAGAVFVYAVHQSRAWYFYSYWVAESLGVLLGFAVVYEIFQRLLAGHSALHQLAKSIFRVSLAALIILGAAVIYAQLPTGLQGIGNGILVVEQATRVVEIGLLMFLFLFSSVFGLHWRRQEFGIALGLGIYVAEQLTVVTMRAHAGVVGAHTLNVIGVVSFDSCLLIWLGYILVPESVAVQAELPKRVQLEQWNQAMMELINQ